jgi:transcriptional regulator with XRE-family HTH domain
MAGTTGSPAPDPFQTALRAAIAASGLPLDRIRYRLKLRDISVSVPTLSNWQSGRRRPERPESLRALAELERVLDLPPSALRSLLGPPRARARTLPPAPRTLAAAWGDADLLSTVDIRSDGKLTRLSHHDMVRVAGRVTQVSTWQVLRAREDGADRWIAVWDGLADIVPERHCRPGRRKSAKGLTVAELVFDRPLARGETTIIEYQTECHDSNGVLRRFHAPTRDYVLEATFDPATPPGTCARIDTNETLVPNASGSVHLVGLNVTGDIGIRWNHRADHQD